jgi:hypothetical protein
MTTQFRIIARIFTAVVFCAAASAATATAADYVITWKNQFASTAICTLNASVVGAAATIPNNIQHKFTRLRETVQVVISSPTCSRITLSASCKYTDAQGKMQTNGFGTASTNCGNYAVTLNPTIPGSFSITTGGGKTPLGL